MLNIYTPEMRRTILAYLIFTAIAVVGIFYGKQIESANQGLRIWNLENIAMMLIGLPFALLLPRAGLPHFTPAPLISKKQILIPIMIGVIFGILDVIIIEWALPHSPHTTLPPYTQPFPYSLFLYFSGAFEIEVFYRLIPLTILLLFFHRYKNGKYVGAAFYTGAILTSLREPLEQWPQGPVWFVVYALTTGVGMNFIQALLFRREGFFSALSVRLGHYLIWHIANGVMIQYLLLK